MLTRILLGFMLVAAPIQLVHAQNAIEVRCEAVDSTFYRRGKIEKDKPGDQVIYHIDADAKTVTRVAVFNKNIPKDRGGGLQDDNTTYQIVHDAIDPLIDGQRLVKAIGKVGALDGYETIVIGDDFCTASRSSVDYFVLYTYKRLN